MQEQEYSKEERHQPASQPSPVEGIYSFQEVPRPEMNRWLQYCIGVGTGIAGIGATIVIRLLLGKLELRFDTLATLELLITMFAFSSAISGLIIFIFFQRIRFIGPGLLTIALILFILCSNYHFLGF